MRAIPHQLLDSLAGAFAKAEFDEKINSGRARHIARGQSDGLVIATSLFMGCTGIEARKILEHHQQLRRQAERWN